MKRILAAIGALAFSVSLSVCAAEAPWELLFESDGISVFRKPIEGSPIRSLRATGVLKAPFAKLVALLMDTGKKPTWVKMMDEARVVRELGPDERLEYYHFATPFVMKDRDLLLRHRIQIDKAKRSVTISAESVEDPAVPERQSTVRARMITGRVTLTAVQGGKAAQIDSEAHAEPRGSVPAWLVNLLQKRAPKQSLDALMKRIEKVEIADYPGLEFAAQAP